MESTKRKRRAEEDASANDGSSKRPAVVDSSGVAHLQTTDGTKPHLRKLSFVDLPGEIRNYIYGAILLDLNRCEGDHGQGRCDHCPVLYHYPERVHRPKPIYVRRKYFGLTQCCRTVRAEFRAMYLENHRVVVPLDVCNQYRATFGQTYINSAFLGCPKRPLLGQSLDLRTLIDDHSLHIWYECPFWRFEKEPFREERLFNIWEVVKNLLKHRRLCFTPLEYDLRNLARIEVRETMVSKGFCRGLEAGTTAPSSIMIISFKISDEYGMRSPWHKFRDFLSKLQDALDSKAIIEVRCDAWDK